MAEPRFDRMLTRARVDAELQRLHASKDGIRSTGRRFVYRVDGGEATVEKSGADFRLRVWAGACTC